MGLMPSGVAIASTTIARLNVGFGWRLVGAHTGLIGIYGGSGGL